MNPNAPSIGMVPDVVGSTSLKVARALEYHRASPNFARSFMKITCAYHFHLHVSDPSKRDISFSNSSAMEGHPDGLREAKGNLPDVYSMLQTSCPYSAQPFFLLPSPPS